MKYNSRLFSKQISTLSLLFISVLFCLFLWISCSNEKENENFIKLSEKEYYDKVYGAWLGQMIGNIYGLPHENRYIDNPGPDNFPYGYGNNLDRLLETGGAFSDDDTDIEYMYLLQMIKHGTTPTYAQLADAWKYHVRYNVWLANRAALSLMHFGYDPPITGKKEFNPHWFQIDPQLVNEVWAFSAPGMVNYAAAKSDWAARITSDEWGVEPTVFYGAMYAAAFYESDIEKLINIGIKTLPLDSYFAETVKDMLALHKKYPNDWRQSRKEMAEKYYINNPPETKTIWNANLNGACAVLAMLYGEGDFQNTLDLSCAMGYDADNQAATLSGLLGVISGAEGIPKDLLYLIDDWELPFNDLYKNVSRHDLPDAKITDIARNTLEQGEKIIKENGGKIEIINDNKIYYINPNAQFVPPLELPKTFLPNFEINSPIHYQFLATLPSESLQWTIIKGSLPRGLNFYKGTLSGKTSEFGAFPLTIEIALNEQRVQQEYILHVHSKNLAASMTKVISNTKQQNTLARDSMWISVPESLFANSITNILNDGKTKGEHATYYSLTKKGEKTDYYGYLWDEEQSISTVVYFMGSMEEFGGWFLDLNVEYLNDDNIWESVTNLSLEPALLKGNEPYVKPHFVHYTLNFDKVSTKGVRILGNAGGGNHWHAQSKGYRFTSITELKVYAN